MIYHSPLCGLRFRYPSELEAHARDEHVPTRVEERAEHITRFRKSGRPKLGPVYIPL
jgi:hypothetical protein